jgi:ABC-type transport system involved in cytochrome c biogenesis ATPase subunit
VIKSVLLKDFTVFRKATFEFGRSLNVIVGGNGVGKTHILKLTYAALAASWEEGRRGLSSNSAFEARLGEKLVGVFRPEALGRMVRRKQGRGKSEVKLAGADRKHDIAFNFSTLSKSEVTCPTPTKAWIEDAPAYLPTRELLTIYPNFVSVYEGHYLEFEETWRDTCLLLGAPLRRGPREARIKELLGPLEEAMDGKIELDTNGRFYLNSDTGRMEMPLVAEGLRKLGMLARLIATGALLDKGYLFWDEPEANLNPRLIKRLAPVILDLAASGVQVFIATHSLFLLREIELASRHRNTKADTQFIGLHAGEDGVEVMQGPTIDDIGDIASLDEELAQSDRYLAESE